MGGTTFSYDFNTPVFKGKVEFPTGLFINGEWHDGSDGATIDVLNPTTGKLLAKISEGTPKDVDLAVEAAQKALDTTWGLNASGAQRAALLNKLALRMEDIKDELAAIECLDNGKTWSWSKDVDITSSIDTIKYYAGWADKISGQTIEESSHCANFVSNLTDERKLIYTRHEPIGVVGQIIPWNFPLLMFTWKIGPALATGNAIVLKPSEFTPLSALRVCSLIKEVGFPDGSINVVTGYGATVGTAITHHMAIDKIAFTGSTLVGRKIMEAAAKSNLKNVTLELGGKSPSIVYDDADMDEAVNWVAHGLFWNHGQCCCAGSRIYVQEGIYDRFLDKFTAKSKAIKVGDPFEVGMSQGPQVSQQQFDKIMGYIESGKSEGATLHLGGDRLGDKGYFINPTIFTNAKPEMKIVKEEIFGPVGVIVKFKTEEEVIKMANDSDYGLACGVFSKDINRALTTAHKLKAGTAWVNSYNQIHANVPFGGYKQSGIGRELGDYALHNYTNVKAVHVNFAHTI